MANQLTGQELLNYLQAQPQNQDLDTTIRGAGYVQNRGGTEGVLRTKFFTAVSAAQGLQLGPSLSRNGQGKDCLLYTSPSPRDKRQSRMPSSA